MKFRIVGADKSTGKDRKLVIEAPDEDAAIAQAKSQGVYTYSAKSVVEETPSAPQSGQSGNEYRVIIAVAGLMLTPLFAILALIVSPVFWFLTIISITAFLATIDMDKVAKSIEATKKAEQGRQQKIICPHCQEAGHVTTRSVKRKKGISGGKAAAAVITGGLSVLATGLSQKENETEATCSNCGSVWYY